MKKYIIIGFFFAISSMVSAQIMLSAYQGMFTKPINKVIFQYLFLSIMTLIVLLSERSILG
jgi:hypothetical protein